MAEVPRFLMLVGAATPPGRLAAAIAAAAEAVRGGAGDLEVDVMNLAETAIDTCDGGRWRNTEWRPVRQSTGSPLRRRC
jgi:hypothetical protein